MRINSMGDTVYIHMCDTGTYHMRPRAIYPSGTPCYACDNSKNAASGLKGAEWISAIYHPTW